MKFLELPHWAPWRSAHGMYGESVALLGLRVRVLKKVISNILDASLSKEFRHGGALFVLT